MSSRFARRGCFECRSCGKMTRETGEDEGELGMCAVCAYECYVVNAESDHGVDSEQAVRYRAKLAELKERRAA